MYQYHRRSIRLKNYNYAQPGAYFITIDTKNGGKFFQVYPKLRKIVQKQWENIPRRYPNVKLGASMIMPNHFHGVIWITERAAARAARTSNLGSIVGAFKSLCFRDWYAYAKKNKIKAPVKIWHRNYYEHIIRNKQALRRIELYIRRNPEKWEEKKIKKILESH